jgi:tagatose 6-phosphate kinase
LLAAAGAGADLLKPNAAEAIEATHPGSDNRLSPETADLAAAVAHLQRLGASTIVISQGADGLVAFAPDGTTYRQAAVQNVIGNPTGAGDAATAGLALAWANGEGLDVALRRAAVLGAAAVRQPTAGEVDLADVHAFEEQL